MSTEKINTSKIRVFAQYLRRKLIDLVSTKLDIVLKEESRARRESKKAVESLEEEIKKTSKDQVIEKVAYTWFNRFCALRYMDVNRYNKILVISPNGDYIQPEILVEAKQGHIDDDIVEIVNKEKLFGLLSGAIKTDEPQQEAYKILLIAVCNYYNKVMPFLFEKIEDYTELLIPDDLLSGSSTISYVRESLTSENCRDVEIIGWLYQHYISEKKDQIFDDLKKNIKITPENIPPATQLFTPKWIVKYMVENSVGNIWLENNPNSKLKSSMKYYIENNNNISSEHVKITSPKDIKIIDPACGSGHILVYAFELLYKIYEEEGYDYNEIPKLILENNLFGLEIDERAGELASFALFMKAREKDKRFFSRKVNPKICVFEKIDISESELKVYADETGIKLSDYKLEETVRQFKDIDNFGSLLVPELKNISELKEKLNNYNYTTTFFINDTHNKLLKLIEQVEYLLNKYHAVIANPPYMGAKGMNNTLSDFVKKNYPDSKSDLMTCFMERCLSLSYEKAYVSMINIPSWMFLSSFEDLRKKLICNYTFSSLLHIGRGIFGIDFGSTAFTIKNTIPENIKVPFYRLHKRVFQHIYFEDIEKIFLFAKDNENYKYDFDLYRDDEGTNKILATSYENGLKIKFIANQKDFEKITGSPIAYWVSDKVRDIFRKNKNIGNIYEPKVGLQSSNTDLFLKQWFEISKTKIGFNLSNILDAKNSKLKWFPINKGGEYRKWYGNNDYVVNWENDGFEIKNFKDENGKQKSRPQNVEYYFTKGITWTAISSSNFSVRFSFDGFIFSNAGMKTFVENNNLFYITSFLNSKLVEYLIKIISPTLNYGQGDISNLPIIFPKEESTKQKIDEITQECIDISKEDWDSRETSWDFTKNELLKYKSTNLLESYNRYSDYWKSKFYKLHNNEEELNRLFIDIYELQDELNPNVNLEDITILKEETKIKNNSLEFDSEEVIKQFISYAVGCIFGRYSLDKEGLILANQGETLEDFITKVGSNLTFKPCENNIIPIIDGDWFDDNITYKFNSFLKASFGEENYEENIRFIEKALEKKLDKYLQKDFYNDHIRRYKKRPIYWMFSSSKETFNVLIYMHRYRPDTISIILNDYLRELRNKLVAHKEYLEKKEISSASSSVDKTKATKELSNIKKQIDELNEYEREILYPLATKQINIDLDDGVAVNYKKFGKALKKVTGLS